MTEARNSSAQALMPWAGVAAVVFLVDFATKFYFESNFYLGESRPVTSFFNLVLAHNTGATAAGRCIFLPRSLWPRFSSARV